MNKKQLAQERAAAHGHVSKIKNAYEPKQRTQEEKDALFAELVDIARSKMARRNMRWK